MSEKPTENSGKSGKPNRVKTAERDERLAEALRANLRRRKGQKKAREDAPGESPVKEDGTNED